MGEIDPVISAYEHLQEKPRQAEALRTLQKVASLVKPIMRQRGWKVGVLTEFYPTENNLLGKKLYLLAFREQGLPESLC